MKHLTYFDTTPDFEVKLHAALAEINAESEKAGLFGRHVITGNDLATRLTPRHLLPEFPAFTDESWRAYMAKY
jgi:hypothetical protein